MKRELKYFVLFLIFLILFFAPSYPQKDPKQLKFKDLVFKPVKPDFIKIKKGVDLYHKVDRENPTVNILLILKTGSLQDPKGKEGLASITFRLMKSGGTRNFTPEKLEEKLDYLSSSILMSPGTEFSSIRLWSLKKNFEETWKILMDIINNPSFDKERFDVEKKKELESIRRRWDNPMMVGRILFSELVYGKDFPDIRRTTTESINQITLDDVKKFYQDNIKNLELTIALAGDFEPKKIIPLLKNSFKEWKGIPPKKLILPKATLASKPGVYMINKEDMTQAVICMGHLGINRLDPENVEINVLNFIYGTGGFNSRLMREVRSHKGLAYTTFGMVGLGRDLGTFFNFCMTKNQSVGAAISTMKDIMVDIIKNTVSPEEIELAKKYEQNSFVHRFDTAIAILQEFLSLKLQGYPDNYLETYIPRILKVNQNKVLEIAKRTIHPEDLIILVVGKKKEIEDQLKALNLGEIKELPLPKE